MRAVITVIGKDMVGILAKVSAVCAKENVNVTEVTPVSYTHLGNFRFYRIIVALAVNLILSGLT